MSGRIGPIVVGAGALTVVLMISINLPGARQAGKALQQFTLYCSADAHIAEPIIRAHEAQSGVRVQMLGDTEATKTFGLVERLRAERDNPRADVFWSSEPFGTIALAREGVVQPDIQYFAARARVVVYNTQRVAQSDLPKTMHDLLDEQFRGRLVMARPAFGTTRGHMGLLVVEWGEDETRTFLRALKANGVRLVDGNAAVVRAVAAGEADVGLTDTDDVYGAQREGLPVDLVYVRHDLPGPDRAIGPMVIPNTLAIVRGGDPTIGANFAAFMLSEGERMLAASDSHNMPMHSEAAMDFSAHAVPDPAQTSLDAIADAIPRAIEICNEELGR